MTHRAPGPDALSRDQADGQATASPHSAQQIPGALEPPADTQCTVVHGGDGKSGAQYVQLSFIVPRPLVLTGGPDPYLLKLSMFLAPLGPALARGEVLERRRNGPANETAREHVANALQLAAMLPIGNGPEIEDMDEALFIASQLQDKLDGIRDRLKLALELLESPPAPVLNVLAEKVTGPRLVSDGRRE